MTMQNITLMPFGYFDDSLVQSVSNIVRHEFRLDIVMRKEQIDLIEFYDPVRRQYNGTRLLNTIDASFATDYSKTIGLFTVDLFIPILTYIFGQAHLNGRSGIVSSYRLSNERYGMTPDENLLSERFCKELIHELGHTFGLIHCHVPDCVMRSGTYVEDIDLKSAGFCKSCREQLDRRFIQ